MGRHTTYSPAVKIFRYTVQFILIAIGLYFGVAIFMSGLSTLYSQRPAPIVAKDTLPATSTPKVRKLSCYRQMMSHLEKWHGLRISSLSAPGKGAAKFQSGQGNVPQKGSPAPSKHGQEVQAWLKTASEINNRCTIPQLSDPEYDALLQTYGYYVAHIRRAEIPVIEKSQMQETTLVLGLRRALKRFSKNGMHPSQSTSQ